MYDHLEMVLSTMTKLFILNLLYSVSTIMITITPVDIVHCSVIYYYYTYT